MKKDYITLAITGASGAQYGLRLLECLLAAEQQVYLMISAPAQVVIATETDMQLPGRADEQQAILSTRYNATPGQLQVFPAFSQRPLSCNDWRTWSNRTDS